MSTNTTQKKFLTKETIRKSTITNYLLPDPANFTMSITTTTEPHQPIITRMRSQSGLGDVVKIKQAELDLAMLSKQNFSRKPTAEREGSSASG